MSKCAVKPLSKCSRDKVSAFDQFARAWGWERDQGSNDLHIETVRENYERTKEDLLKRLEYLEHQNRQWQQKHLAAERRRVTDCKQCETRIKAGIDWQDISLLKRSICDG
jgi:hypothetical protein